MKRGQITIFVIVGLVILLVVGLFLILPNKTVDVSQHEEAMQVTNVIQQCLSQVGEQSIRTVSGNGGYADTSTLKDIPTADSQVIVLPPEKIPLWHEIHTCKESGAGCIGDLRPALCAKNDARCPVPYRGEQQSMQENIELLVERNIEKCMNSFVSVPQVQVKALGKPTAHALIREQDVALSLEYPLEIHTSTETLPLKEFSTTLDVKLPQLYRLAYEIQSTERKTAFLEEAFLHLLSIYNYNYEQPLPPFRDIQFSGAQHTWTTPMVQRTIEQGLLPFMDFVQIANALESYVPLENPDVDESSAPYANGIYEYMAIKLGDTNYPLGVRFEYPRTPLHLDINGEQLLKPRRMPDTGVLKLLGLNVRDYRFRYSASFPMLVHITDPAAFSNRGLDLNFGMEANIRNNHALNVSEPTASLNFAPTSLDLSSDQQLVNTPFTVHVIDRYTQKPLANAEVLYACGTQFSIGQTDAQGIWKGKLPYCIAGGYILANSEGYATAGVERNTAAEGEASVTVQLWQLQTKTITVYKRTVADIATNGRTPLGLNDSLVLEINKLKEMPYEDDLPLESISQFGGTSAATAAGNSLRDAQAQAEQLKAAGQLTQEEYDSLLASLRDAAIAPEAQHAPIITKEVALVPGRYTVQGTLIYNGLLQIPERKIKDAVMPAQNFTSWQTGGVIIDGTGPFLITPEDLYSGKNITIYVLEQQLPQSWDDVEKAKSLEEYQTYDRRELVTPEFS